MSAPEAHLHDEHRAPHDQLSWVPIAATPRPSGGDPGRSGHQPHSARHAFATLALDAGVALRDVQEAMGHADPRTTRRYDGIRHSLDRHATYAIAA